MSLISASVNAKHDIFYHPFTITAAGNEYTARSPYVAGFPL